MELSRLLLAGMSLIAALGALNSTPARDMVTVLNGGDHYCVVDTLTLKRAGRSPVPMYVSGFFADIGMEDTANLGAQSWPGEYIRVSYLLGFTRMTSYTIAAPVEDQWYTLPIGDRMPESPKIKFLYADAIEEERRQAAPSAMLAPNPVRLVSCLRLSLPEAGHCRVLLYDATGRQIRTVTDATLPAGVHSLAIARRDAAGRNLAAGIYVVGVTVPSGTSCLPMVVTD